MLERKRLAHCLRPRTGRKLTWRVAQIDYIWHPTLTRPTKTPPSHIQPRQGNRRARSRQDHSTDPHQCREHDQRRSTSLSMILYSTMLSTPTLAHCILVTCTDSRSSFTKYSASQQTMTEQWCSGAGQTLEVEPMPHAWLLATWS